MGFLLKEALRSLCCNGGWCYAVFWKIAPNNPSILVLEEGHYELARHSELSSGISEIRTQLLHKEWDALSSPPKDHFEIGQLKHQEVNRIVILVKTMMMPQVHVVGEGMVGSAASMGNHRWILREAHFDCAPISEIQAEVQHQFLAGIQTITVIPLLPHGVVQLGSTKIIMEDLQFVSHVKSLFVQIGRVPGALLSDNMYNVLSQKKQVPLSLGIPVSSDRYRNPCRGVAGFTPLIGNSCRQKLSLSPSSRFVSQSCSSFEQMHDMKSNASLVSLTSNPIGKANDKSDGGFFHSRAVSVFNPGLPRGDKLEEEMGTQVIIPNSDVQLNQHISPYKSSSKTDYPASVVGSGVSRHKLMFLEQQILSSMVPQEPVHNYVKTSSNNMKSPQQESDGGSASKSFKQSVNVPLPGRSETPRTGNETSITKHCRARSLGGSSSSCLPVEDISLQSVMGVLPVANNPDHSNFTHLFSGESLPSSHPNDFKHMVDVGTMGQQRIWKDLLEILEGPSSDSKDLISRTDGMPIGSLEGCWVSSAKNNEENQNACLQENGIFTTNCVRSLKGSNDSHVHGNSNERIRPPAGSGCDLLDTLDLNFESQQCHYARDDMPLHGIDENAVNLKEDVSTCPPQLDVSSLFDQMNDVISESDIFSESGRDQLLDAVVSQIHSSAKPLQDDVSCKTRLTKADGSSFHECSVTKQIHGAFYGHSQALAKPDVAEKSSSDFRTSCSLNKNGEFSQTDSVCKSQIGNWIEDGPDMKCDSISTAFSKGADEAGKQSRKRPRNGENPRRRPKDRQMIQDRVKELREIVPNGAKCSIDALLERTIKHMIFLQSVTKHADKLKQTRESKIISKEDCLFLKDNSSCGKTLAFEVSSQSMVCPIIVEDLNEPHQMLIEILCEERGFFLEIAAVIRGLGLTILKGAMEAHDDKVWARFTVEANMDITRMNVFLSLMRLLEQ